MDPEIIREWSSGPFHLVMWESTVRDNRAIGRFMLGYRFTFEGKVIFEGEDFGSSPMDAIDSDRTVVALLTFFSVLPEDGSFEMEGYTEEQKEFVAQHGEELGIIALEMEELANREDREDREGE